MDLTLHQIQLIVNNEQTIRVMKMHDIIVYSWMIALDLFSNFIKNEIVLAILMGKNSKLHR